ncbi:Solute carrier 2, facilitated glucose transporter member 5 [Branchiostoma belcheri]|nr:Solute carrier 2, facilitated glucose transporter member 5 [Branchiostoma belcheri]
MGGKNDGADQPGQTTDRLTFLLAVSAFVAAFGTSFQYGYSSSVVDQPANIIKEFYNQSYVSFYAVPLTESGITVLWATTVSVMCLGGLVGSFLIKPLTERFGRKGALLISNVFSVTGAILFGFSKMANSYHMVIIGRIFVGIQHALSISVVPMYLAEVSPTSLRGGISVMHQGMLTVGILLAQILGLEQILGSDTLWPVLLAFYAVPSGIQLVIMPFLPESPRYLLINKQDEEASRAALRRLRGTSEVDDAIQEMRLEHEHEMKEPKITVIALLQSRSLRPQLIMAVGVMMANQLSGINAIFAYVTSIFENAGVPEDTSAYATIGTGAVNCVVCLGSVLIIDRVGRRPLLIWPLLVMTITFALLTITQALTENLFCDCCPNGRFGSVGDGSMPGLLGGELFRQGARPAAMTIQSVTHWVCNFIIGLVFPILQEAMGAYVFLIFMVFCGVSGIYFFFRLPETKNKTFDEIQTLFGVEQQDTEEEEGVGNTAFTKEELGEGGDGVNPTQLESAL